MNIYAILQKLPTNGYTTALGALGLLFFGFGGLVTGKLDQVEALGFISAGITALGIGSKFDKLKKTIQK